MELLITLTVLSAVGMVVIPNLIGRNQQAAFDTTERSLETIRRVLLHEYRSDQYEMLPYPLLASRVQHPQLKYLFHNPAAELAGGSNSIELSLQWSYDRSSGRGWSGPYLDQSSLAIIPYRLDDSRGFDRTYGEEPSTAGEIDDPAPSDAWGNPIVLQQPVPITGGFSATSTMHARLVSAGPDGVLNTPSMVLEPTAQEIGDDLVVYLRPR